MSKAGIKQTKNEQTNKARKDTKQTKLSRNKTNKQTRLVTKKEQTNRRGRKKTNKQS